MAFGNFGKTVLLLACDGSNGSQTIPDSSVGGNSGSTHGNATIGNDAQLSTANKKFGTASLLGDESQDYIKFSDHADFDFTSVTNLTIDLFWKRKSGSTANHGLLAQYTAAAGNLYLWHVYGSGIEFEIIDSTPSTILECKYGAEITDTSWHHIALIKVGNEYGIYVDGTQGAYTSDSSTLNIAAELLIGAYSEGPAYCFADNIDQVRITHANIFNAAPNSTPDDTITVPTAAAKILKINGLQGPMKVSGVSEWDINKVCSHG